MKAATPSPRGFGKRSEGDSRACRPHRPRHRSYNPRGEGERAGSERITSFGVARVFAEEYMANYQAVRALMGKGRNAGEGAVGLSKSSANKGARKSAVKNGAKGMSDMAGKAAR